MTSNKFLRFSSFFLLGSFDFGIQMILFLRSQQQDFGSCCNSKKTTTPKQNICEIYVNVLKAQVIDPCGLSKEKLQISWFYKLPNKAKKNIN